MNTLQADIKVLMLFSFLWDTAENAVTLSLVLQLQKAVKSFTVIKLGEKPLNIKSGMHGIRDETYVPEALHQINWSS